MFIRMKSDGSNNGRGFSIRYQSNCNITLENYFGIIESPNHPNNYPSNINCAWKIKAPLGNKVHIDFDAFSMESGPDYSSEDQKCRFDYLKISTSDESQHNEAESFGPFCSEMPGNITINNNLVEIT